MSSKHNKETIITTLENTATTTKKVTETAFESVNKITSRGPLGGFKKFISRGSMIDMAVAVVMGSAVTNVVNSIVNHLINPLIAIIGGKPHISDILSFTVNGATFSFGEILNAVINFLLVSFAVYFCVIIPINKLRDMTELKAQEQKQEEKITMEAQMLQTLQEIRDELKRSNTNSKSSD